MKERLKVNDNMKTAMMLVVVFYHACMFFTGTWFDRASPVYEAGYLSVIAKYLNTFHVQTFTMASGFLFYALKTEQGKYSNHLKADICKRAKQLFLPYISAILFWALPFYIVYSGFNIRQITYKYVLGCAPSQLWFLPMLLWLFAVAYIVFQKHRPSKIGLASSILISIGGGYILNKIGCINILQIVTAVKYAMFYYLGVYLYEKRTKLSTEKIIFCILLSVGGFVISNLIVDGSSFLMKILDLLTSTFGSLAGILMIYGLATVIGSAAGNNAVWKFLKKNSFGIYLFHQQLIYPCIMLLNGRVYPIIQVTICFILAIAGASIMAEFFRKYKVTKILFGL